jgi:predicted aspartyl protease
MAKLSMTRRGLVAAAGGLALTAPVFGQQRPSVASSPVPEDESLAAWVDAFGRPAATVFLNNRGPFRFLVDTGATTTVVAEHRAADMGLDVEGMLPVNGTTGVADLPFATANRIQSGSLTKTNVRVVLLEGGALSKWDGVLGANLFVGKKVVFDIPRKTVMLTSSASPPSFNMTTAVGIPTQFKLRNGLLAELGGAVGKVNARLILDTGADCSIANPKLSQALLSRHRYLQRIPQMTVLGITGEVMVGEGIMLPDVKLGGMIATRTMAVAVDASVFNVLDLQDTPAMLVGIDVLSRLQRFSIDYGTREFLATPMAQMLSRAESAFG